MKFFVCMCLLFAVSNATLLELLEKGGGGGIQGHGHVGDHGGKFIEDHNPLAKIIKLKVVNDVHGGGFGYGHAAASAPPIINVIHQKSSDSFSYGYGGHSAAPAPAPQVFKVVQQGYGGQQGYATAGASQVIQVIHQGSGVRSAQVSSSGYSHAFAPHVIKVIHQPASAGPSAGTLASAPLSSPAKVIRLIHENAAANGGSFAASGSAVQQQFGSPTQVIRIIHEKAQSQPHIPNESFSNGPAVTPQHSYAPTVHASAPGFISQAAQYSGTASQNIDAAAPAPQYSTSASTFTAPEPAAHVPAPSYGPPH